MEGSARAVKKQTATCRRFTGTVRKNTSFALITARQPRRVALTSMHLFCSFVGDTDQRETGDADSWLRKRGRSTDRPGCVQLGKLGTLTLSGPIAQLVRATVS